MELIRKLLLELEAAMGVIGLDELATDVADRDLVAHHAWLLVDAKFAVGKVEYAFGNTAHGLISSLTWQGHDFLASARSDTRWQSAMQSIRDRAGDVGVGVLSTLLASIASKELGL